MAARARAEVTLIAGEDGLGEEHVAQRLRLHSHRHREPFAAVSCGEFAETVPETELFGHARGASTAARQDRVGVFEAAHGGALFLEVLGDVSLTLRERLLRVLQAREVRRM